MLMVMILLKRKIDEVEEEVRSIGVKFLWRGEGMIFACLWRGDFNRMIVSLFLGIGGYRNVSIGVDYWEIRGCGFE